MERIVTRVRFERPIIPKLKRVAAYARVSSGKDAMLHSLSSQISYYSNLIQTHSGWEYAGVYADEALTGTKDNRYNFQRLINDCREGKIDMVITKSISRFARNTVTLLETVHELKSLGIDVYFEEEKIHSMEAQGELILTFLAGYAQEESLSASENQKWRVKRNFESGMPWTGTMLGYRYEDGRYTIVPEEANIVKMIFESYLSGLGTVAIANMLNRKEVPTRFGNEWCKNSVVRVLQNYSYTGNLMLQKTYRENHLTKRKLQNNGELPQYHAENTHAPIIDIGTYNLVQLEMNRRAERFAKPQPQKKYQFTGIITCANCGKHYRRKVTKTNVVWICTTYNTHGKSECPSKAIPEETLLSLTEELGGIDKITGIQAYNGNLLRFTLDNGERVEKQWKDRSRSESWKKERRQTNGNS